MPKILIMVATHEPVENQPKQWAGIDRATNYLQYL